MQLASAMPAVILAATLAISGLAIAQDAASMPFIEPHVVMEASPPPPFIYWAPEGSTIVNHPRLAEVWIAEIEDGLREYYFGDQCRASRFQGLVGQSLNALPEKPANATWRMACATCAVTSDLGRERMNIFYDDDSRMITSISCG